MLFTLALYHTVLLVEPLVAVVLIVKGEPFAGIAAYVSALGAALAKTPPGPAPKPAKESTRQPQVPFDRAAGVPVDPVEAVMELPPLVISVVRALFSSRVIVRPAESLVAAETVSELVDCLPVESGVIAPRVTVGPEEYEVITGLMVRLTSVFEVCVSPRAVKGKVTAAKLTPKRPTPSAIRYFIGSLSIIIS